MCRWNKLTVAAFAAIACLCAPAYAQQNSLFGDRGALSNTGVNRTGTSGTTGRTGGTTGGAGSAFSQQGGGRGAAGTGGQTGGTGPAISTQAGTGGVSTDFGGGFVGRGDNAGRFVGQQQAGQQQVRQFFSNRGGRGGQDFTQANVEPRAPIRPRARIAFNFPKPSADGVATKIATRFERLAARRPAFDSVNATIGENGTVTLTGVVDDESSAKLVAAIVRLEPGVRSVESELEIRPATSELPDGDRPPQPGLEESD